MTINYSQVGVGVGAALSGTSGRPRPNADDTTLSTAGRPRNSGAATMSGPRTVPLRMSLKIPIASAAFTMIDVQRSRRRSPPRPWVHADIAPSTPPTTRCAPSSRKNTYPSEGSLQRAATTPPSTTNRILPMMAPSQRGTLVPCAPTSSSGVIT